MNPKILVCAARFAVGVVVCSPVVGFADDSAASIAAGGLVPRRETQIVMAKEILHIGPTKVIVDYDFRNDTDQDVATEVAFPIPPYENERAEGDIQQQSFRSFHLWVDGKPIHYESEVKATIKGKDVTGLLEADHIDIPTFGHYDDTSENPRGVMQVLVPDLTRLSKPAQSRLIREGLFEDQDGTMFSLYTVHLQYHWTQTFPAHSTVHIRHEYTPIQGYELLQLETLKNVLGHREPRGDAEAVKYESEDVRRMEGLCPDPSLLRNLVEWIDSGEGANPHWVDFILTSANTWRQPIEDFTLIVDRGKPEEPDTQTILSFCPPQNAPVEKLDADRFQIHLSDFVPKSELRIGYFDVPVAKPAQKK